VNTDLLKGILSTNGCAEHASHFPVLASAFSGAA